MLEKCAQSLLDAAGDTWLDDKGKEVTRSAFIKKLRVLEVTALPNGNVIFELAGEGLFRVRHLTAEGSLGKGIRDVEI